MYLIITSWMRFKHLAD